MLSIKNLRSSEALSHAGTIPNLPGRCDEAVGTRTSVIEEEEVDYGIEEEIAAVVGATGRGKIRTLKSTPTSANTGT